VRTVTEDFEWGADGDNINTSGGDITWSQSTPGTCLAQIDTAQAHGGTRSLGIYRDGTNWPSAYFSLTAVSNHYEITFEARHTTGTAWVFYHGNGVKRIRIGCSPAATNYYYYNAAGVYTSLGVPHANDTWATITLANIDFTAGTFDFYADGAKLATCTMETSASSANACSYGPNTGTGVTGWCWIDDIVLTYLPGFPYEFPIEFDIVDGIYCYIDWDGDGDFSAGFEDVSDYLRSFAITRGKDSNMGRAMVGTADITLKDVAGTFIPSSTVSPLTGYVIPGKKVQISRYYKGAEYVLFTGYLDDIQNDYADTVREAYFSCSDGSERLANSQPFDYITWWTPGYAHDVIAAMLVKNGYTSVGVSTGNYKYNNLWPGHYATKTIINNFEDAEGGWFYVRRDGIAAWEPGGHRAAYHSTSEWTCPGTVWRSLKTQNNWKDITNEIVLNVVPKYLSANTTATIWANPENADTLTSPLIEAGCSRTFWPTFVDVNGRQNLSPLPSEVHTANSSSAGGGVNPGPLAFSISYDGNFGDSRKAIVTNATSSDYYLTSYYYYGAIYTDGDKVTIQSESTTSQDAYGFKSRTYDLIWAPASTDMQTIADDFIATNATAKPTYIVELVPNSSDALQHALDLDISDRFTLEDSRISLSRDVYIDKVQHKWSVMDGVHHTYWTVSCAT
jgi:hypothetical protein